MWISEPSHHPLVSTFGSVPAIRPPTPGALAFPGANPIDSRRLAAFVHRIQSPEDNVRGFISPGTDS